MMYRAYINNVWICNNVDKFNALKKEPEVYQCPFDGQMPHICLAGQAGKGARERDILLQFLLEAIIIPVLGCFIGLLLGIGSALLTNTLTGTMVIISGGSVVVAFSVAAAVGIFFGYYPAHKAAQLDPIEALRYQ